MERIVVFGNGLSARLAHFYLTYDSPHDVVAFTVDRGHTSRATIGDLPLVPFDEVVDRYPPSTHRMFVAIGYGRMNKFREERYLAAKDLGYQLISYVSSRATRWPDTEIGDNCFIMEDTTIQPFVRIGDDVTIWSAAHIGQGSSIGDHAFVASHAVVSSEVTIGPNCFLGVNSTIADSLSVGRETLVGAGAHLAGSTQEREVYAAAKGVRLKVTSDRLPAV